MSCSPGTGLALGFSASSCRLELWLSRSTSMSCNPGTGGSSCSGCGSSLLLWSDLGEFGSLSMSARMVLNAFGNEFSGPTSGGAFLGVLGEVESLWGAREVSSILG